MGAFPVLAGLFYFIQKEKEQRPSRMSFGIASKHFYVQIVHFDLQFCFHNMNWYFCVSLGFWCFFFFQMSLIKNFSGIFHCCPRQGIKVTENEMEKERCLDSFHRCSKELQDSKMEGKQGDALFTDTPREEGAGQERQRPGTSGMPAGINFFSWVGPRMATFDNIWQQAWLM